MQTALEHRLTELAAITTTDTLFATLEADRELRPLAGAVATTLRIQLDSKKHVAGSVRSAFRTIDGQPLAVDAIVVGLGRALYLLRSEGAGTEGGATRR